MVTGALRAPRSIPDFIFHSKITVYDVVSSTRRVVVYVGVGDRASIVVMLLVVLFWMVTRRLLKIRFKFPVVPF